MLKDIHNDGLVEDAIFDDLQEVVRAGFHRFRRKKLKELPRLLGCSEDDHDRSVCKSVRYIIQEGMHELPPELHDFAAHLLGLTDDTANASAGERERIAGEGLEHPLTPPSIRAQGGPRETVLMMLAGEIHRVITDEVRRSPPQRP